MVSADVRANNLCSIANLNSETGKNFLSRVVSSFPPHMNQMDQNLKTSGFHMFSIQENAMFFCK